MTYCKNCGTQIDDAASVCPNCGVAKGVGNNYCSNCGESVDPKAIVCTHCGVATKNIVNGVKSKMAAGLLGIFLGSFGIHNFYLGYTRNAVIQLVLGLCGFLTCGITSIASGVWGLIEGIMILTGSGITTDASGEPLGE